VGVLIALQYRYALLLLLVRIPIQITGAHQEVKVLEANFGEKYRNYRKGTWF
jgi:protein-S-isoprenylcysteine O-methyltransferase Ste14